MTTKTRTPACAYVRVSSKGQLKGHGPARQLESIRAFARRAGYDLVGVYEDSWTGTESLRPAFARMLEDMLSNGCRTVIVESLDRFARDLSVQIALLGALKAKGVRLMSANTGQDATDSTDPMVEALIAIQGTFAQLDKRLLTRKLRVAREAVRVVNGRCEGVRPYGFSDPVEAEQVKRIRAMRKRGDTLAVIADKLNAEGVRTRSGRPWARSTVYQVAGRRAAEILSGPSVLKLKRRRATAANSVV